MSLAHTNVAATTAAVANRIVTSANMKVGTYTVANASAVWPGGFLVTVTHSSVTGTDTLGTIAVVGVDLAGAAATDTIVPVADSTVTGVTIFRSVTSVTGAGWVINTGNDTITVGVAAGCYCVGSGGVLGAVSINTTAAAAVTISDSSGTIATLKASIAEGTYLSTNDQIRFSGFLKIATTSTNDVTAFHSDTVPSSYAMS